MTAEYVWIFGGAVVAGFLGSLTGLGGGMVVVPLLVLGLGVDFYHAIGASIMAVIATSSVASCRFARREHANIRIALFLATATVVGAVFGAYVTIYIPKGFLMVLFGLLLIYSVASPLLRREKGEHLGEADPLGERFQLNDGNYQVHRIALAYGLMALAGLFSGLLGIGSGAVKVLAMDRVMQLPFRVSTTTSNIMIGITAVASAGVYLHRGLMQPDLISPLVLGVSLGAFIGSRLFERLHMRTLRTLFSCMLVLIAAQMLYEGVLGG